MKYTPLLKTNLYADLDELDLWLGERGITQRNRFRIYRENLIAMRDRDESISDKEFFGRLKAKGRVNEILASYVEGAEIVDALKSLRKARVEIPDELLHRALDGGPDASRENNKNNQGRNAMFELSIGAMVARMNLTVKFNTGNPDVEFRFENRRILMECKRVLSVDRTIPVITDGMRQLRKQVKSSASEFGIVAVNISRAFNRGDGYWTVPANSVPHEILYQMIRRFISNLGRKVLRVKDETATGVLFYAAAPFKLDGLGYIPARAAYFCAFDLNNLAFVNRLAFACRL